MENLYTIKELCAFAKITLTHYYSLKSRGLGPNLTHLGTSVRVSEKSIQEWVEKYTEKSGPSSIHGENVAANG